MEMELDRDRLRHWLQRFGVNPPGFRRCTLTPSGHASGPEIVEMIRQINPKVLIPVHTEHPEVFVEALSRSGHRRPASRARRAHRPGLGSDAMIPARLSLRNFLCYRDNVPPLDFTGIHVACLAGDNGHGKTALLDASRGLCGGSPARAVTMSSSTPAKRSRGRFRVPAGRRPLSSGSPEAQGPARPARRIQSRALRAFARGRRADGAPSPATRCGIRSAESKRSCTLTTTRSSIVPS